MKTAKPKGHPLTNRELPWYGWTPDLPDHRDHLYGAVRRRALKLPKSVDLRDGCSAIEDQGQLGSCTANALVANLEFLELKDKVPYVEKSRLFVYYNERAIEGTVSSDSGAQLRDGIKALAKLGVCTEKRWPYDIKQFAKKPPIAAFREAAKSVITSYQRIQTLDEMRQCLADGYPFVFGFTAYSAFESATVAKTGKLNMPTSQETMVGGHAVCAVGYDDKDKRFLVRNSWGTDWGMKGYYTMPYAYLDNRNLSDDFWTIRR